VVDAAPRGRSIPLTRERGAGIDQSGQLVVSRTLSTVVVRVGRGRRRPVGDPRPTPRPARMWAGTQPGRARHGDAELPTAGHRPDLGTDRPSGLHPGGGEALGRSVRQGDTDVPTMQSTAIRPGRRPARSGHGGQDGWSLHSHGFGLSPVTTRTPSPRVPPMTPSTEFSPPTPPQPPVVLFLTLPLRPVWFGHTPDLVGQPDICSVASVSTHLTVPRRPRCSPRQPVDPRGTALPPPRGR